MEATHRAFSDDSRHREGRFNSLALVTLEKCYFNDLNDAIIVILQKLDSNEEFKWVNLKSEKKRDVAVKMIDFAFENLSSFRIDVIKWDLEDRRHKSVLNRDDVENLVRMYYHLVSVTFSKRWSIEKILWEWFPDKQSGVDWRILQECICNKKHKFIADLFNRNPSFQNVKILNTTPLSSKETPLIQLADLFAGMSSFSSGHFRKYIYWETRNCGQQLLFDCETPIDLSKKELYRFDVVKYFYNKARNAGLSISLKRSKGFKTYKPKQDFVNFWQYEPQHQLDKAPSRILPRWSNY